MDKAVRQLKGLILGQLRVAIVVSKYRKFQKPILTAGEKWRFRRKPAEANLRAIGFALSLAYIIQILSRLLQAEEMTTEWLSVHLTMSCRIETRGSCKFYI
jgi:hypothetical protein